MKRPDRPDLDPAVLAEVRKIFAIHEHPFALLHAQYVSLQNQYALQHGTLDEFMVPPRTAAEEFDSKIDTAIYMAHLSIALSNPKKLTARKKIAHYAQGLASTLRALKREEKDVLVHFLPHSRQATFDDFIAATRELADEARLICRLAGRPLGWLTREARHQFVNRLLDAAAAADGNLTLNPRTERGTLVDAIELLLPYLPKEMSKRPPSFSTLKRLRKAWGQNRKRKLKRTLD